MKKAIIGKKLGMTQIFGEDGTVTPVTVIEAGPCAVVQTKTNDVDGYNSVQLSFGDVKLKNVNKPIMGHYEKYSAEPKRILREFQLDELPESGSVVNVDIFEEGDIVDVSGTSKGKGFQGVIKRHGQRRGPMTHGSKYHRRPGSMGASAYPARVPKGKKLPGHMGHERVTVQNLEVVGVEPEDNVLLIKGSVPGTRGSFLEIRSAAKHPES